MTLRQKIATVATTIAFVLGWFCAKFVYGQLPPVPQPLNVPSTTAEEDLGRELFFDPILSFSNRISCATCHNPVLGWSDGMPVAVGIDNKRGTRRTPTIVNAAYYTNGVFWDIRNFSLTDQCVLPITNPVEMGRTGVAAERQLRDIVDKIDANPHYHAAFAALYPKPSVTVRTVARCLACFQGTVISYRAPIDRYEAGDFEALDKDAVAGLILCKNAGCFSCHPSPLFTDKQVWNVGVEMATRGRIVDRGRAGVTDGTSQFKQADIAAFKTPTLRDINKRAPFGHNGQLPDLASVVDHFAAGGYYDRQRQVRDNRGRTSTATERFRDPNIDPRIKHLNWGAEEKAQVVHFLKVAFEGADYPYVSPPILGQ